MLGDHPNTPVCMYLPWYKVRCLHFMSLVKFHTQIGTKLGAYLIMKLPTWVPNMINLPRFSCVLSLPQELPHG
jgi:hypothetical protein